ncbi:MAG: YiiX/YebB-like N1pC/P60 family cysteine hydrolase, partial [Halobacteriovoraceae bacterium]|nr:YiiX/YebB-like N1pC/P60 family cysteine hydrolase [Halobacteriovoraceae bacterium]
RWRRGFLDKDKKIEQEIFVQLQPLDIITEKVGYTPTDFFIPGHFGHNAIWLGTKEQLKELGIWNHPVIKPFQKDIEKGQSIIETDRSGTHLKSLSKFMNVDEFGLLRFKKDVVDVQVETEKVLKIYETAFAQLGKTYDFNFDVETTDQLVCSELLYQSFGDVNWPTEPYIGRTTISPDNVVSLALYDNAPIDLIYYMKGTKKGTYVYKDIDDLAKDVGFVKKNGLYKEPYKVCKTVWVRKPGTRGREKISKRECETRFRDLIYKAHPSLPDLAGL